VSGKSKAKQSKAKQSKAKQSKVKAKPPLEIMQYESLKKGIQ